MKDENNNNRYDDIIHLPHPTSKKHPRMSLYDRAAQFSPFAALTGHEEAIKETARITERKKELSEEQYTRLNEKLMIIKDQISYRKPVSITYFMPDQIKEGGSYVTHQGVVKKIKEFERLLILEDKTEILIDHIEEIEFGGNVGI